MITRIKDIVARKVPILHKRSSHWNSIRNEHLEKNPTCAVCESTEKLNVHHIKPFHLHPELELESTNLITLCESKNHGINCHLLIGHLGNFQNINPYVLEDIKIWNERLKEKSNITFE